MLMFPPGSSNGDMECLNIIINDDNVPEDTELFIVELTTTETYVTVNSNPGEIIIRDNDGEKD